MKKDKVIPVNWKVVCVLHDLGALKSVHVRLNKKGINLLLKAFKEYERACKK